MPDLRISELTGEHYEIARKAVEDVLIEWRDMRLSVMNRNNGLVVKESNGKDSHIIRLGTEEAVRIGLKAVLDAE